MATGIPKHKSSKKSLVAPLGDSNLVAKDTLRRSKLSKANRSVVETRRRSAVSPYIQLQNQQPCELADLKDSNLLFLGDNLSVMEALAPSHAGGIDLIYLDPPYATGMDFHSRSLHHAYEDSLSSKEYVEFMRRRFKLMRELLSNRGSIYVHIGHQMLFNLKLVMDDVFGSKQFRNLIVRRKCSSKNYTSKSYPNLNDYILFYSKDKDYTWNKPGTIPTQTWLDKEYPFSDSKGKYKLVPVHAPGTRNGETGKPWKGMMPPDGKHWQLTPAKLTKLDSLGEIHWSRNNNPRRKVYLPDNKTQPVTDYWENFRDAHHQSVHITGYPTEKNLDMMKLIIKASSNEGDLVLDPFCGSGTTLQAAHSLNRRWVGIDNSLLSIQHILKRFHTGTEKMGDYVKAKALEQIELHSIVNHARASTIPPATFKTLVEKAFYSENTEALQTLAAAFQPISHSEVILK